MTEKQPLSAEPLAPDAATLLPWSEARTRLAAAQFYWLATVHPDGRPHVRPVLAVWVDGAMYTTTNSSARKARNLEYNPRCAITVRSDNLDLVVEGDAAKVREDTTLQRVATAYGSKYDWPVTVRDGALDAAYGAPTAGPPPYEVFGFGRRWSSASAPTTRSPPAPHAGGSEGPCLTWRPEFSIRCPSSPPRSRPRPRATPRTTRHRRSGRWCHLAPRRLRSDRAGGRYR